MKSLDNQTRTSPQQNGCLPLGVGIIFLILGFVAPLQVAGQYSEIEILGPAKTPFTLILHDTTYPSSRANRVMTNPVVPGKIPLHIRFHDARYPEIHDTVVVLPGMKHLFRLKKGVSASTDSVSDLGVYLREKSGWRSKEKGDVFVLVPLETVSASEQALARINKPASDTVPLISHPAAVQFTRDTLNRVPMVVQRPTEPTVAPAEVTTNGGSNAGVMTAPQITQLKAKMQELRFEEDKVKFIHSTIGTKQLLSDQLYEILMLLDFERSKLQLFKRYYGQLADKQNHARIYKAFEFSSTIDELNKWVYEQSK